MTILSYPPLPYPMIISFNFDLYFIADTCYVKNMLYNKEFTLDFFKF